MTLNYEELRQLGIITNANPSEYGNGSYNLTVDSIVDMEGKSSDFFILKPQGMAYVIFKEKLEVPNDIIGFAHVKTALTKRGVMATNIGIIDPGYEGYISTLLINFGKDDFPIIQKDAALRVTFNRMTAPTTSKPLPSNNQNMTAYSAAIKKNISNLDEKFLNLSSINEEITKKIAAGFFGILGICGLGSFFLSAYFNFKNSSEKDLERSIKKYETTLDVVTEDNRYLQKQLDMYKEAMKNVDDSILRQRKQIDFQKHQIELLQKD